MTASYGSRANRQGPIRRDRLGPTRRSHHGRLPNRAERPPAQLASRPMRFLRWRCSRCFSPRSLVFRKGAAKPPGPPRLSRPRRECRGTSERRRKRLSRPASSFPPPMLKPRTPSRREFGRSRSGFARPSYSASRKSAAPPLRPSSASGLSRSSARKKSGVCVSLSCAGRRRPSKHAQARSSRKFPPRRTPPGPSSRRSYSARRSARARPAICLTSTANIVRRSGFSRRRAHPSPSA
jgi:hypothetical protein